MEVCLSSKILLGDSVTFFLHVLRQTSLGLEHGEASFEFLPFLALRLELRCERLDLTTQSSNLLQERFGLLCVVQSLEGGKNENKNKAVD